MDMLLIHKMINSKKGAEKILSVYWFIILTITVVGIYGMVTLYYNHPYDIRELEASLLANKVADCISYKGKLEISLFNETTEKVSEEFQNNFLKKCNITFNVEDEHRWKEKDQYYLEINFFNINEISLGKIAKGNIVLKEDCEIKEKKAYEKLPKCVNKRFYSLDKSGKGILIDIFVAVRKTEKNVK